MPVFRDVTLCCWVRASRCFVRTCHFIIKGSRTLKALQALKLKEHVPPKRPEARTQRHNLQDWNRGGVGIKLTCRIRLCFAKLFMAVSFAKEHGFKTGPGNAVRAVCTSSGGMLPCTNATSCGTVTCTIRSPQLPSCIPELGCHRSLLQVLHDYRASAPDARAIPSSDKWSHFHSKAKNTKLQWLVLYDTVRALRWLSQCLNRVTSPHTRHATITHGALGIAEAA